MIYNTMEFRSRVEMVKEFKEELLKFRFEIIMSGVQRKSTNEEVV